MRSVGIAGASGFIGLNLVKRLRTEGFNVCFVSRDDFRENNVNERIKNCSIVINLVGESISGIWTKRKRGRIHDSRILTTRKLVDAVNIPGSMVGLLIQVSGVGIYDHVHIHSEESIQFDEGFLSTVIRDWEGELAKIRKSSIRVVILRLGIVLAKKGGLLKRIMFPLRYGIGFGVISEDYFPFVQLDDLMNVFIFCIEKEKISGIVNVVAPVLTKINQFFRETFKAEKGKAIFWLNKGLIHLVMGDSGSLLTKGQRVIPAKLLDEGFVFMYDNIEDALNRACN